MPTLRTRVTEEIEKALRGWCEPRGVDLSDLLRDSALRKIGREDLIGTMPKPGRPKKESE